MMAWSWNGYKHNSDVPVLVHFQLQNELKDFIVEYVTQNQAGSSNVLFHRFWTEPTLTKEIRAAFEYSFDVTDDKGEKTNAVLTGYAYLTPKEGGENEWSLDRVEINNQVIEFQKGSLVTPEGQ